MDCNCPEDYVELTSSSITETKTFIDRLNRLCSSKPISPTVSSSSPSDRPSIPPLIQPIITPRFALSCTDSLLTSLGQLAASFSPSVAIQTHLSENPAEIRRALELFPDCQTYAGVYEKYNLLGPGTILAHCVHLSDEERIVIKRSGAGVSHCPTSNVHLNSGTARVRDMLDMGIKVGSTFPRTEGFPDYSYIETGRSRDRLWWRTIYRDPFGNTIRLIGLPMSSIRRAPLSITQHHRAILPCYTWWSIPLPTRRSYWQLPSGKGV